ncbi:MAG: hypothetical protein II954_11140 [Synergistaceae bacterium]|nr:hypothetical protein [Synergistaceae bacterium]
MSDNTSKGFMIGSLPWWQAVLAIILCAVPMYLGIQSKSMTGTFCSNLCARGCIKRNR